MLIMGMTLHTLNGTGLAYTLEYRKNGGGVKIIGGLEMVRYDNNEQ